MLKLISVSFTLTKMKVKLLNLSEDPMIGLSAVGILQINLSEESSESLLYLMDGLSVILLRHLNLLKLAILCLLYAYNGLIL